MGQTDNVKGNTAKKPGKGPNFPGLTLSTEESSAWKKMAGPVMAEMWSRSDNPPLEPDKAQAYHAAFVGAHGESRSRLARCLTWCDADAGRYSLSRLDGYRAAFEAYPKDERIVFFVGALCVHNIIENLAFRAEVFYRMVDERWLHLAYWKKYNLRRQAVHHDLALFYTTEPDTVTPDRVDVVEHAVNDCDENNPDLIPLADYLARAYRNAGRQDTTAERVYRFIFVHQPKDAENNAYLARMYWDKRRQDAAACGVYGRMAAQCDESGNPLEGGHWLLRQARAYRAMGRADEATFPAYQRAHQVEPGDLDLEAGYLTSLLRYNGVTEVEKQTILEAALLREAELAPRFAANRWSWGHVLRQLALLYGQDHRVDDTALALYARVAKELPEDRELKQAYALAMAHRHDYSEEAIPIYEEAIKGATPDPVVELVLAHAYIATNAATGPRRAQALNVFDNLFRQGNVWPELIDALTIAYMGEERVNDVALSLWARAAEADEKNGEIRFRLAQEWESRSDFAKAAHYYRAAAKLLPKEFAAQYRAAALLIKHFNDYTTAIRLLQKAVKLPEGEKHLEANFLLGEALLAREKRDEAKQVFQYIADAIEPNHAPTLVHLAKLNLKYEEEGLKIAEELYDKAKTAAPEHAETYRNMADLYREKGEFDAELEALEKYIALGEPDPDKYRQLADLYLRRGDYARAENALRQVIAHGKADKQTYTMLGEIILQARTKVA